MAQTKRSWKLQEFVAHGADVHCLAMGHKSGRVMVTGGEDRKVNLWAAGKPHCIMSLTGHTMTVEAVRFGHAEDMVVAGSLSGALKVWDLEQAKILRTLTGHRAGITALDFHPYGDYSASGSMDSNIKLWDIRRKGCIFTYKGHNNGINCLRFSPDGRWISSAGADSVIKIWDLTAGKLITDLKGHKGPVNVVEFHPNELLLASGSADRTVRFWDLESFQEVSSTEGDSTPIRTIKFHPDGMCLYSGSRDMLKVYSWEPIMCLDSVPVNWGEVSDMAIAENQLIGASFLHSSVSSYVIALERVQPVGGVTQQEPSRHLSSSRKNYGMERPATQSTRQASFPKEDADEPAKNQVEEPGNSVSADIQNQDDYRELFQVNCRRIALSQPKKVEPFRPPPDDPPAEPEPVKQRAPVKPVERRTNTPTERKTSAESKRPVPQADKPDDKPSGVAAEDFLPKRFGGMDNNCNLTESDVLGSLQKGHAAMEQVLSNRGRNLQIVRAMWTAGNTKTAVDSAISMNDPAVMVDILNVLNSKTALWNLDLCTNLLPQLKELLSSKYECYVVTTCASLKLILKNMGPVIKANLTAPPSIGVDISREERYKKCNACYTILMSIRSSLDKQQNLQGKLGSTFKELQILMGNVL
ncbi:katanin p80 WD40 repeat-containing subunit B1-like isoform X2 [Gigantopelta aegis]|uniref:katanin p80 WD40 repeat-containing subunit B1-like isoform X2 n=1 Tax=Gigantopelta aegis TaxID=1735272 RepID=UPI001B88E0F5|nr:katanin p80 WD40 repeat-containing subunit B1-like isoform X2 [Gigantopelta aegis]